MFVVTKIIVKYIIERGHWGIYNKLDTKINYKERK